MSHPDKVQNDTTSNFSAKLKKGKLHRIFFILIEDHKLKDCYVFYFQEDYRTFGGNVKAQNCES